MYLMIQKWHWSALGPIYILILIDIMMSEKDGFQLYDRLKKVDPHLKVCFLTASEMYREDRTYDKDLFLQKPISTDDLITEINKKINSTW